MSLNLAHPVDWLRRTQASQFVVSCWLDPRRR